jgi:adenine-specific DNA-methyltransferase
MDYIGSKTKLNDWIFSYITQVVTPCPRSIFLDGCSGSGAVSRHAASLGYYVVANDLMRFPSVVANGGIGITKDQESESGEIIKKINSKKGVSGYFHKHFCDESIPPRLYFTAKNAQLIDRTRLEIELVSDDKIRDYLLYCALVAMSRVSNTTGVQAAFLKKFKDRAKTLFSLKQEQTQNGLIEAYSSNIISLLVDKDFRNKHQESVLYIDPPYNQRQYGPNYHLYETFVRNDNPHPSGATGLRDWKVESRSDFCTKKKCLDFLKSIVDATTAPVVFISYNSDGILSKREIEQSFKSVKTHEMNQRRYKSDTSSCRKYNNTLLLEYLFQIEQH